MKPISIDTFRQYRFLSEATLSADGRRCVFTVSRSNDEGTGYTHDLYCYDFSSCRCRQLTSSGDVRGFLFEDDTHILFPADRDQQAKKAAAEGKTLTSYYRLSLEGGEARKAFSLPYRVTSLKKLDDQWVLALISKDLNEISVENLQGQELKKALKQREEEKDYEVLDELPYWFNGRGFINKIRTWAVLFNVQTRQSRFLSPSLMDVRQCEISPDGTRIAFAGPLYDSMNNQTSVLMVTEVASGQTTTLIEDGQWSIGNLGWMNGNLVISATDQKTWGSSENQKLYTVDVASGAMTLLCGEDLSLGSSVGSDARLYGGRSWKVVNDELWLLLTWDNHSELTVIDAQGHRRSLHDGEGSVDFFDSAGGRTVLAGMRQMKLQELYELQDGQRKQLTFFNEAVLQDRYVAQPQKLSFINSDGVRIDGWVLKPIHYNETGSYPAVLDIHGGPKAAYGEVFMHEMQYWASQGYFVFFCNPRGSDGRGNEFMDLRGKYGTVDYADLMEFTDRVLEAYPAIDPARVAVTGGSYGGFMTNWIIGHTDRFVCAASQRSISNWFSKSLTTDIGYYHNMCQMDSTPWSDPEKMWSFSPLKYADKAVTPTLFIHSDQDYRCWMAEALQMFQALKLHGVATRICLFHGENHELSRSGKPIHRIRRLKEITQWFDRYTGNQSDLQPEQE